MLKKEYFSFSKKLPNCVPKWLYHFAFPAAMNESSHGSTSSLAFGGVRVLDFGHSNRCVVVSRCFLFFLWLHWVFVAVCRLSLVAANGGYSSLRCTGFLVAEHGL